ncbi:protein-L-isoaspartate O-methyltransferase family protein [Qipengyuania oceanensis]|uniref:Protein-L-isoaspartate O-methyltransferase n=1 Tax=Qipengyuania oceanensis TaxID=1463597 RepID=A0A844YH45_9SPHN|nr:protein-L-isoaspartate O-methyltransferase [Qipengyuania oceanensis]MXO63023.1 protein-L-isoaspartate O-methyltransferase [Qipengyuania oceanensis]
MTSTATQIDFAAARRAMVDSQLRTSGVNEDYVLARMGTVPREDFVPATARGTAYMDRAIPLGEGKFLSAPLVHARMLVEAEPRASDRVLLVDGGSGYLPELIRPLVGKLDVISPDEATGSSRKRATYSLLLVDGAIEDFPEALVKRVEQGGRVVTGIVKKGVTRLAVGRRVGARVSLLPLAEIGIALLPEFAKPKEWSF